MFHATGRAPATSPALRLLGESNRPAERCNAPCGGAGQGGTAAGMSTVCDRSCYAEGEWGARFGGHGCGAGDAAEYGAHCRACYTDPEAARAAENRLAEEERVALEKRNAKKLWEKGKKQQSVRRRVLRADGRGGAGWEERGGHGDEVEEEEEGGEGGRRSRVLVGGGRAGDAWRDGEDDDDEGHMVVERRRHVIMCDTLMPPPSAPDCSIKCQRKDDTVRWSARRQWS
eukprot:g15749.t1